MIFSFSEKTQYQLELDFPEMDVFCFFKTPDSISIPENLWLKAVVTSLKLKRPVLILEAPLKEIPSVQTSARWSIGSDFLLLAPRALSTLTENAYPDLDSLKAHLSTFK